MARIVRQRKFFKPQLLALRLSEHGSQTTLAGDCKEYGLLVVPIGLYRPAGARQIRASRLTIRSVFPPVLPRGYCGAGWHPLRGRRALPLPL